MNRDQFFQVGALLAFVIVLGSSSTLADEAARPTTPAHETRDTSYSPETQTVSATMGCTNSSGLKVAFTIESCWSDRAVDTPGMIYRETFDNGPGGWFGWISNSAGPKPLEIRESCAISRSPWWIDYNHAPPGAGYLHLLYMLLTRGPFGEHHRETAGENRFVGGGFGTDFTNARVTLRLKGELIAHASRLCLLVQSIQEGVCSGWMLTGQPFEITRDWSEQTVVAVPDPAQWTSLGSRHDRVDFYGTIDLPRVLRNVNTNILLVLFPLDVVPMGPLSGDLHRLRPEKDYPVWRSRLPEGFVMLDEVRIEFAGT